MVKRITIMPHPVHASIMSGCPAGETGVIANMYFGLICFRFLGITTWVKCENIFHAATVQVCSQDRRRNVWLPPTVVSALWDTVIAAGIEDQTAAQPFGNVCKYYGYSVPAGLRKGCVFCKIILMHLDIRFGCPNFFLTKGTLCATIQLTIRLNVKGDDYMGLQQTLRALADPIRREILNLLKSGRMSAGEIASHFLVTDASISRHLSVLKEADLIRDTREGKFIFYDINTSVLEEIMLWIKVLKGENEDEKLV